MSFRSLKAGQGLQTFWQGRSPREKKLLGLAGLFLLLFILVMVFGWLHSERRRLVKAVPKAEAGLAQMQMAAEEQARLKGGAVPPRLAASPLADALRATAMARGLVLTVEPNGEGVLLKGQGSFDTLIAWLADVQRDHALRPMRLEMTRDANLARFEATLVFPPAQ